jgi:hypothetical protein
MARTISKAALVALAAAMSLATLSALSRSGVTVKTMAEGTFITVRFFPLRDGRDFGALAGLLVTCGTTMPAGGCTEDTGKRLIGDTFNAAQ